MSYKVRFFNPAKQYKNNRKEILGEIDRVLSAGDLILRGDTEKFEESLAKFVGTKYAIGVSSGTDALIMCVKYLKAKKVLVPYYTFKSTVSAVIHAGAKPIFKQPLFNKAKVGIVAHIAGELSELPNTEIVIEDACQALGAVKNPTSFAQCWSFYPAKILGAAGDAGGITTNDEDFYKWCKEYRNHFKDSNLEWGSNHRIDNLQAAILNVKFKYLDKALKRRKEIARMYDEGLKGFTFPLIVTPVEREIYQDYIITVFDRDGLYEFLKKEGIETLKNNYPFPIKKDNQHFEDITLRIPCNETLENKEVEYVIKKIKEWQSRIKNSKN
jgi:dTDP-4-amino-4,6-dideoxygalactose transaminase